MIACHAWLQFHGRGVARSPLCPSAAGRPDGAPTGFGRGSARPPWPWSPCRGNTRPPWSGNAPNPWSRRSQSRSPPTPGPWPSTLLPKAIWTHPGPTAGTPPRRPLRARSDRVAADKASVVHRAWRCWQVFVAVWRPGHMPGNVGGNAPQDALHRRIGCVTSSDGGGEPTHGVGKLARLHAALQHKPSRLLVQFDDLPCPLYGRCDGRSAADTQFGVLRREIEGAQEGPLLYGLASLWAQRSRV